MKLGICEPVYSSKWAAPIVSVFKPDGSICICGDYKQTVNSVADCDKYPVPKTEGIFATLHGRDKFTKLNLSQACQQLVLSPKSRELVTVNTHKNYFNLHVYSLGFTQLQGYSRGNLKID